MFFIQLMKLLKHMKEAEDKVRLTTLSRSEDSYECHVIYEEDNIHESLKRYELIKQLMQILVDELPEYGYTLDFSIKDGKFLNELEVINHGINEQDNTSDTLGHEIKEITD